MAKEKARPVATIEWYRPEDYDRVREISADRAAFPLRFEDWSADIDSRTKQLEEGGCEVKKVLIDPKELIAWAAAQRIPIDRRARLLFMVELAKKANPARSN